MEAQFEWDEAKNARNREKHNIDFMDAILVFAQAHALRRSDRGGEERLVATGMADGLLISVIYTVRDGRFRIISARRARENEKREYRARYSGDA